MTCRKSPLFLSLTEGCTTYTNTVLYRKDYRLRQLPIVGKGNRW